MKEQMFFWEECTNKITQLTQNSLLPLYKIRFNILHKNLQ